MKWVFWIGLAGMAGTLARYAIGAALWRSSQSFPWNTLLINVIGSLVLGVVYRYYNADRDTLRTVIAVGFCGAFTTFSTFSLETVRLAADGRWMRAGAYVSASVVLGLLAILAGFQLAGMLQRN